MCFSNDVYHPDLWFILSGYIYMQPVSSTRLIFVACSATTKNTVGDE